MSRGKITLVRPPDAEGVSEAVVVVIDRGLDALKAEVMGWAQMGVVVGIRQDKGSVRDEDGGITVAGYAAVNEFGSEDGRVPERSFIRSTLDTNRDDYVERLDEVLNDAIDATLAAQVAGPGTLALEHGLGLLGMEAAGDVQATIRDLRDPPNSPRTLHPSVGGTNPNGKKSTNPLIDTGRMRASIDSEVRRGTGGRS